MKNYLLTAVALCAFNSSTMPLWAVVNVDKPEVNTSTDFDLENGGDYYLYNYHAKMFMTSGNSYGTQASLGDRGYLLSIKNHEDELSSLKGFAIEFPKEAPGNNGGKPKYLYIVSGGTTAYIDYNLTGSYLWKIQKSENGLYRISIIDDAPEHGSNELGYETYMGQMNSDLSFEGIDNTVVQPMLNPDAFGVEEQKKILIDWAFVSVENYDIYLSRIELYNLFEKADEYGYSDISKFEEVYNNNEATLTQINEAISEFTHNLNSYIYDNASEENPLDLTHRILNSDFGGERSFNSSGWTLNGMKGGPNSHPVEDSDRKLSAFAESWTWGNNLADVSVVQKIKDLPGGKYRLYADMLAVKQTAPDTETKGVYLIADGGLGETRYEHKTTNSNNLARTVSLDFSVIEGNEVTIGARTESCNVNWFAVDNFKLEFLGRVTDQDIARDELKKSVEDAQNFYTQEIINNGKLCSIKGEESFNEALNLASEGCSNKELDTDSLVSLRKNLLDKYNSLVYDINIYNGEGLSQKKNNYENMIYENEEYPSSEIFVKTEEFISLLSESIDNRTFDPLTYDKLDGMVDSLYKNDILEALKAGMTKNVTGLILNPKFDNNNYTGWNGNPAVKWNVADVYNREFDVNQVLKGLPAGSYRITANGAYRPGSTETCMAAGPDDPLNAIAAYLYGNDAAEPLKHWYSGAFDEAPLKDENGTPIGCFQLSSPVEEWNGKYVPYGTNARECWNEIFTNHTERYFNEVVTYVDEDGTLVFGVKTIGKHPSSANSTAFDNFRIEYLGDSDLSGFKNSVKSYISKLHDKLGTSSVSNVSDPLLEPTVPLKLEQEIVSLCESANNDIIASDDFTLEEVKGYILRLKDTMALVDSSLQKSAELIEEYQLSIERTSAQESEYTGYLDCMYDYEASAFDGIETLDEINDWIIKFRTEFTAMSIYGKTENVSKDTPADLTSAIVNPGFEKEDPVTGEKTNSDYGWNLKYPASKVLNSFIEYWNTKINMSQSIYGLPSGYYRLEVNAYYRYGSAIQSAVAYRDNDSTANRADLFVKSEKAEYRVPLVSMCKDALEEPLTSNYINVGDSLYTGDNPAEAPALYVPSHRDDARAAFDTGLYENELYFKIEKGQKYITLGIEKEDYIQSDWSIIDNFRLTYFGDGDDNMPDGVDNMEKDGLYVVSTSYYSINGVKISNPKARGIYIRKDVYNDGTVKVNKVYVK